MNDFVFYSPTKIVFGRDAIDRTGEELAAAGFTRALIVYGGGSVVRTGTLDRVTTALDNVGIAHAELGGVRPNPEITSVREGIEIARAENVDVILPVGGGSAMDAAKAIALGAVYEGDVWDFFVKRAAPQKRIPVVAVPTIPASGSEASNSAVISNDAEHLKCGLNTDLNRPVLAIMDGMEHELSALDTSITHGAGLAVVFPAWMRYVWQEHPERVLAFAKGVFDIEAIDDTPEAVSDAVTATIDELQEFFVSLGMPRTLGELGVKEGDIDQLLAGLKINRGERFGSFKQLTLEDARAIYQSAL